MFTPEQNEHHYATNIFLNAFSWKKGLIWFKFCLCKFISKGPIGHEFE